MTERTPPDIPTIEEIFGRRTVDPVSPERPDLPIAPRIIPRPPGAIPEEDIPFTPRYGSTKVCPMCGERKPTTKENWYRQKVMRLVPKSDGVDTYQVREKTWIPSSYCRPCTSKRNSAGAQARRALANLPPEEAEAIRIKTMKGPCDVCGMMANSRQLTEGPRVVGACPSCIRLLAHCKYDPDLARANWLALFRHLADEERVQREVRTRTDRIHVPYHKFNTEWPKEQRFSHAVCITQELAWRAVMRWLGAETKEPPIE